MKQFTLLILLASCAAACAADPSAPAQPPLGAMIVHPIDRSIMVYVPAGPFIMGIDKPEGDRIAQDLGFKTAEDLWAWDAYPRRTVHVDGFFIDRCEVTVEQWRLFAAAHPEAAGKIAENFSDNPADQLRAAGTISWKQAQQYANWVGRMVPTNAQWEKAARGDDGRLYPWGNEPPSPDRLLLKFPKGRQPIASFVGLYPRGASPCGALDMLSNQYEWVSEWLEPYPNNPQADRMLEYSGHHAATLRGGSPYHGPISLYAAKRMGMAPEETHFHLGMRTVWEPPANYFTSPAFSRDQAAVADRLRELDAMRALIPADGH